MAQPLQKKLLAVCAGSVLMGDKTRVGAAAPSSTNMGAQMAAANRKYVAPTDLFGRTGPAQ